MSGGVNRRLGPGAQRSGLDTHAPAATHGTRPEVGRPRHPAAGYRALVLAAEVVRRLAEYRPAAVISEVWKQCAAALPVDDDVVEMLHDPSLVAEGH
jgi:hypothetical protein